jgi:hypothetical protein
MSAERSGLFPFVAFNVAGSDLLGRLTRGKAAEQGLERLLADDVEALILMRVPQIPSSRAFGNAPVASYDEYAARVPADRSEMDRESGATATLPRRALRDHARRRRRIPLRDAHSSSGWWRLPRSCCSPRPGCCADGAP